MLHKPYSVGQLRCLENVASNIRHDAKDSGAIIPETTTDADVLNVWEWLYRFYDDCGVATVSALGAGIVVFDENSQGFDKNGSPVSWDMP